MAERPNEGSTYSMQLLYTWTLASIAAMLIAASMIASTSVAALTSSNGPCKVNVTIAVQDDVLQDKCQKLSLSYVLAVSCIIICTATLWVGAHSLWLSLLGHNIRDRSMVQPTRRLNWLRSATLIALEYYIVVLWVVAGISTLFAAIIFQAQALQVVMVERMSNSGNSMVFPLRIVLPIAAAPVILQGLLALIAAGCNCHGFIPNTGRCCWCGIVGQCPIVEP